MVSSKCRGLPNTAMKIWAASESWPGKSSTSGIGINNRAIQGMLTQVQVGHQDYDESVLAENGGETQEDSAHKSIRAYSFLKSQKTPRWKW